MRDSYFLDYYINKFHPSSVIVVYDSSNLEEFCNSIYENISAISNYRCFKKILCASKMDIVSDFSVNINDALELVSRLDFIYCLTSAKTSLGITDMFNEALNLKKY